MKSSLSSIKVNNNITVIVFLIVITIGAIFIQHKNRFKTPKRCPYGEGFVYNEDDYGAVFGLGGFKCDKCEPEGGSYVDNHGYCKQCDDGKFYNGFKCVSCPIGHYLDTSDYSCVCDNNVGYYIMDGECSTCPKGQYYINGNCDTCYGGNIVDDECMCPKNYAFYAGSCVPCGGGIMRGNYCECPTGMALSSTGCKTY